MNPNELVLTADGSHSLRSRQFGVDYHSVHGAIQESEHVFIGGGLLPLLNTGVKELSILEMGFGTGLNALLVRRLAAKYPGVNFRYLTYEQFPVSPVEVAGLNYPDLLEIGTDQLFSLHDCGWEVSHQLDDNFSLLKHRADFLNDDTRPYAPASIDLIFYDAFAPASQPEFWEPEALVVSWEALRMNGTLITYCAKGQFKRNLKTVGFTVEPLPGPPGKREMTRGRKE